ncbi:MAG: lipid A deacylase LpxR family protein [bacterium]|nr:lipid A deacylase LpxR family protein [bacterium]
MIRDPWKIVIPAILLLTGIPEKELLADQPKWLGWQFQWENDGDVFSVGTDKYYTNGVHYSWLRHPDYHWTWVDEFENRWCTRFCKRDPSSTFAFTLGQDLYTPENIASPEPVPGDRPYAGLLYGSFHLAVMNERRDVVQDFELLVGFVGPVAGGEFVQRWGHEFFNSELSQGWDNQLAFEPVLNLSYVSRQRLHNRKRTFDFVTHTGGAFGNVMIKAHGGATLRVGRNISGFPPLDVLHVAVPAEDRRPWEYYLFGGFDGRMVLHNIFLDGNTLRESPEVDKNIFVYDLRAGILVRYRIFQINISLVRRSKEFEPPPGGGDGRHVFRSLTLSMVRGF